jgi:hypothetical protein
MVSHGAPNANRDARALHTKWWLVSPLPSLDALAALDPPLDPPLEPPLQPRFSPASAPASVLFGAGWVGWVVGRPAGGGHGRSRCWSLTLFRVSGLRFQPKPGSVAPQEPAVR